MPAKRFVKLFLASLIIFAVLFVYKTTNSQAYASDLICGVCPAGTDRAGTTPGYGYGFVGGTICNNLIGTGNPTAVYCNSDCTSYVPSIPLCTGIIISPIPDITLTSGDMYYHYIGPFSDNQPTPYSGIVDYGDGTGPQWLNLIGYTYSLFHTYQKPGQYTVTMTIKDDYGLPATASGLVKIVDVPPVVGTISVDNPVASIDTKINTQASFTDADAADTHTAVWDWGDGATSTGAITEASGSGSVIGDHAYSASGVYTVTLTVTDSGGLSSNATYKYISVYDPSGSFITGSGKFTNSQGETKFGVEAKYVNNNTTPNGKINLELKDGSFKFKTTSLNWLVISGGVSYLSGVGKVNDSESYSNILLTVVDGTPTNTPDTVRIQITDQTTGNALYDNEPGSLTFALPTTQLTNGAIKIHQ